VRLAPDADGIRVEVRDDGRDAPFAPGRGLTGMRERVEQLGGRFEAAQDGGFAIRAQLPTGGARP
jgi:signal transduction histidine kinase